MRQQFSMISSHFSVGIQIKISRIFIIITFCYYYSCGAKSASCYCLHLHISRQAQQQSKQMRAIDESKIGTVNTALCAQYIVVVAIFILFVWLPHWNGWHFNFTQFRSDRTVKCNKTPKKTAAPSNIASIWWLNETQ